MSAPSLASVAALWQVDPAAVERLIRDGQDAALWELRLHLDTLRCMAVTQPDGSGWVDAATWKAWRERAAAVSWLLARAGERERREERKAGQQGQMRWVA